MFPASNAALSFGIDWRVIVGLSAAAIRSASFVAVCAWMPKAISRRIRGVIAIVFALLAVEPWTGPTEASSLITAAFTNVVVGGVVGFAISIPAYIFFTSGTFIDTESGLLAGVVFDPSLGVGSGPIGKWYSLAGQTLFVVGGGMVLLAQSYVWSFKVVALDGTLSVPTTASPIIEAVSTMFTTAFQFAIPVTAVLFMFEVSFALLSRMVPQMNVFLVGLPAKMLITMFLLTSASILFPSFVDTAAQQGVAAATEAIAMFTG